MNVTEQVQTALANYADLPQVPLDESVTPETIYMATPDRLTYALGWVVANAIVAERFLPSAIDVLPVFHPEHGWDRFLITRRVSCKSYGFKKADEFGRIMLSGEDAPRLTTAGGKTLLSMGSALREDPEQAIAELLKLIPRPKIQGAQHARCAHTLAKRYPYYYNAVTELVVENPGVVPAREIYIDDQEIDGQYHPLYLHAVAITPAGPDDRSGMVLPVMTYDWFQLQYGDLFAFFDMVGSRTIYRTSHGTWSRVRRQLEDEPDETVKQRIGTWLRIGGEPSAEVDSPKEGAAAGSVTDDLAD